MAEKTDIAWCDSTANYWEGCTKVSEEKNGGGGCDSCYAEAMNNWLRRGENWGPGAPRRKILTTSMVVRSWQRNAAKFYAAHSRRRRVFVNSISDTMDNEVEQAWREEIWADARACPDLLFMIVTKRIGNAAAMLPADWGDGYPNVMVLVTVVNQREAERDVPKLVALPARWRGLSVEPMLGWVDLSEWLAIETGRDGKWRPKSKFGETSQIDLVIGGGESGRKARPTHPDHPRSLRDQCAAAGTAYFYKQNGEFVSVSEVAGPGRHHKFPDGATVRRVGKKAAGRTLDGREHLAFPGDFQ